MSILLAHLSDCHLRFASDTLLKRAESLIQAIMHEMDASVKGCIIAFTGDATDKGFRPGFEVAKQFLGNVVRQIEKRTGLRPLLLTIPGNHDVVEPEDSSLRNVAIDSLKGDAATSRPSRAVEEVILAPLDDYFSFATAVGADSSPSKDKPYYVTLDREFEGKIIRFHLLNSSWMCKRGLGANSHLFPIDEINPPNTAKAPDYEITLLHHPFGWFMQPEVMRPLRNAVEAISDMILTGHEHVGRSTTTAVHGVADYEYREGDALQDGDHGNLSGFHVLRLDFETERQTRLIATCH